MNLLNKYSKRSYKFFHGITLAIFVFSIFLNSFKVTAHTNTVNPTVAASHSDATNNSKLCFLSIGEVNQYEDMELEEETEEEEEIQDSELESLFVLKFIGSTIELKQSTANFNHSTHQKIPFYLLYKNSKAHLLFV